MRSSRGTISFPIFAALCVFDLLTPAPAFAYIDPLAGSVFLQALIAGVLGGLLAFKQFGSAIKSTLLKIWQRLTG